MRIHTTFPSGVTYSCDMDACNGCCTLFEDIAIYEDEIQRVKKLGYSDFYTKRKDGNYLKTPCPFLEGSLCRIHREHGQGKKFITCRKYPFSASQLRNGNVVVDVKWACPGVSLGGGRLIDVELLKEEFLEPERLPLLPIGKRMPFHSSSGQEIEWEALERLYSSISEALLEDNMSIYRTILALTGIARAAGSELGNLPLVTSKDLGGVEDFLRSTDLEELSQEVAESTPVEMDFLGFASNLNLLFEQEVNPRHAIEKLGLDFRGTTFNDDMEGIFSQHLDQEASNVLNHYLVQSLRESLTRPWDFISTIFWALGVAGFADYMGRLEAYEREGEVTAREARKALMVVDFLNKHFSSFRDQAFEIYPPLGTQYLQFFLAGKDSGLGGYWD